MGNKDALAMFLELSDLRFFHKSLSLLLFMTNGEHDALLSGENEKNQLKMTFSFQSII